MSDQKNGSANTKPGDSAEVDPMIDSVRQHADNFMESTVALRRTLHEWPELGNELPITRDTVMSALDGLPLNVTLHESTSGIAAMLEGSSPGPTMLLRGDMDALEMPEDTGLEFSSRHDGVMHACGHDTHTAMLVGAAKMLSERRNDFAWRGRASRRPFHARRGSPRCRFDERRIRLPGRVGVCAPHQLRNAIGLGEYPRRTGYGVG
jgi:hypothetical protein